MLSILRAIARGLYGLFALVCLVLLLAGLTAVPVLHLAVLGYLFEVQGRLARTGKQRESFPLLELAPRIGAALIAIWIVLLPVRFFSTCLADAQILAPAARSAAVLTFLTKASAVAALLVILHLLVTLGSGRGPRQLFCPFDNLQWLLRGDPSGLELLADRAGALLGAMRPGHHLSLGLRGFLGSLAWLLPPTFLFSVADRTHGGGFLVTLVGGFLLMAVLAWLPFLQAHYAAEGRIRAFLELGAARRVIARAPITSLLAILATLAVPFPLYLARVVIPPRDAVWLITLAFVIALLPGRLLAGLAYHRATRRESPAWWGLRWTSRALMVPFLGVYVVLLFFTQFLAEHGKGILFEHHAFLLRIGF